jgi:thiol-disulfide isomerase/thioredoxin
MKNVVRTAAIRRGAAIAATGLAALVIVAILGPQSSGAKPLATAPAPLAERLIVHPTPRATPKSPFTDGNGAAHRLADFRGRFLLLNFWATWCLPCVAEMPALDRLQAALGGTDFTVIPISQDHQGRSVVAPFYRRLGLTHLTVYLDDQTRLARAFEVRYLPTTVLIDRRGQEVARLVGDAEWDSPEAIELLRRFMKRRDLNR